MWSDISYFPSSHVKRTDCSDTLRPGLSPFLVQISRFTSSWWFPGTWSLRGTVVWVMWPMFWRLREQATRGCSMAIVGTLERAEDDVFLDPPHRSRVQAGRSGTWRIFPREWRLLVLLSSLVGVSSCWALGDEVTRLATVEADPVTETSLPFWHRQFGPVDLHGFLLRLGPGNRRHRAWRCRRMEWSGSCKASALL